MSSRVLLIWFFRIAGLLMIANAFWMEFSALHWFENIPANLEATGVPNIHFIHDVALAYFVCGVGLLWSASNLGICRPVFIGVTMFTAGHALNHVGEIITGQLPHAHWWIDLPLVFLPGLVMTILSLPVVWKKVLQA